MTKSKEIKEETPKIIDVKIPEMAENTAKKIVNVGGNYILTDVSDDKNELSQSYVDQATYDMQRLEHVYSKMLDNDTASYVTNPEEIANLSKNTQNDVRKVIKINAIAKYYINKEDLIGRVVETIENNVNTNFSINYPSLKTKTKKEKKMLDELSKVIDRFNRQINIPKLISDNAVSTYIEGNYIFYLRGDNIDNGYSIVNYPLDLIEITDMKIDDDPIVAFKVNELTSRLQKNKNKYGKLKSNTKIDVLQLIDAEVKRDYPSEIYDAYKVKDQYAFLDPLKIGVTRINNLKGKYGVTPILKALGSQLMLETLDNTDRQLLIAKTKKIFFQKSRKELMGKDFDKPMAGINPVGYAHSSLLASMSNNVVVYSSQPFIEELSILEPKNDLTDPKITLTYRQRVLNALGISFLATEGTTSITTVNISYSELLRTINKITNQLENIINKFYQSVCIDNGFPVEYAPTIKIQSTDLLSLETKLQIADVLFSKIGLSYNTVLNTLGFDYEVEKAKRVKENEEGADTDVFIPHANSYTSNSNELINGNNTDSNTNSNGSKKSGNTDKNEYDKQRQEAING
jgi:hypothetical protein